MIKLHIADGEPWPIWLNPSHICEMRATRNSVSGKIRTDIVAAGDYPIHVVETPEQITEMIQGATLDYDEPARSLYKEVSTTSIDLELLAAALSPILQRMPQRMPQGGEQIEIIIDGEVAAAISVEDLARALYPILKRMRSAEASDDYEDMAAELYPILKRMRAQEEYDDDDCRTG